MNNEQLAYIAGIVDGEGTISLCGGKTLLKDSRGKKYRGFQLTFRVTNTNKHLIKWLYETSNLGKITDLDKGLQNYSKSGNAKPFYEWYVPANDLRILLPKLIPYLVIKKEQANIVLDWLNRISKVRGYKMTEEIFQEKLRIVHRMKKLNKRGLN